MKKKIGIIALVALMAFALCGCGSGDPAAKNENPGNLRQAMQESVEAAASAPVQAPTPEGNPSDRLVFDSLDVYGNPVSSADLFGGRRYTLVNCWTSWCGWCAVEMPELEALASEFGARDCGVIGILLDGDDDSALSDGLEILEQAGVTYTNVLPWPGIKEVLGSVQTVPASFIVDENGTVVSEWILGAQPELYESTLNGLLGE